MHGFFLFFDIKSHSKIKIRTFFFQLFVRWLMTKMWSEITYFLIWTIGISCLLTVLYNRVRNCFFVTVNCWFCNTNFKLPFNSRNEWFCQQCFQFNGFTKDGDYSRSIPEQFEETLNPKFIKPTIHQNNYVFSSNGLCSICNANQELKIKQLALYVPFQEKNYDQEIEIFRNKLEKAYKLCENCECFVSKKLRFKSGAEHFTVRSAVDQNMTDRRFPKMEYVGRSIKRSIIAIVIGLLAVYIFKARSFNELVVEFSATSSVQQFLFRMASRFCFGLMLDLTFALSTAFLPYLFLNSLQSIVSILFVILSLMISDELSLFWKVLLIFMVMTAVIFKYIASERVKMRCKLQELRYNLQNRFEIEYEKEEAEFSGKISVSKSNSSTILYSNTPLCGQFSDMNLGKCEKYVSNLRRQSSHSFKNDRLLVQPPKLKIEELDHVDAHRISPTLSSGYESLICGGFYKKTPDADYEFDSVSQVDIPTRNHLFSNASKTHLSSFTPQSHFQPTKALSTHHTERYFGAMPAYSSTSARLSSPSLDSSGDTSQLQINANLPTFQIVFYSITCFVLGFLFQIFARELFV